LSITGILNAENTRISATVAKNSPSLGSLGEAPLFISGTDKSYGLVGGINAGSGAVWLQSQRVDSTATAYGIALNPAGGDVGIGGENQGGYGLSVYKVSGGSGLRAASGANTFDVTINGADAYISNNVSGGTVKTWVGGTQITSASASGFSVTAGKLTTVAASATVSGSLNIPSGSGNTPVSGDLYNLSGVLTFHNGTAAKSIVCSDGALGTPTSGNLTNCTADGTNPVGTKNVPQNSQSTNYTLVLSDAGKHILHPSADTTARTITIPANSSVAFPIGTAITFVNQNGAGVMTIAITTDTLRFAGTVMTGSRSLAANGMATALKITATEWIISGAGIS
jgi:hypothetical protein